MDINSYYYLIVKKIENNIKILEKNKALSIKYNDYNRCKEIKNEIVSLNKLIEFYMKCNEDINNNSSNEYLYGSVKYKNNKKFYIYNCHRKLK